MKKITLSICAIALALTSYAGDILTLNNQKSFEGKVTSVNSKSVEFKVEKQNFSIPASEISSIQFENANDKALAKFLEVGKSDQNKCTAGTLDAENFHGRKGGAIALGALFGPFALVGTAILANPTPEKGARTYMMSKNKDLFSDPEYLSCYKKKAKGQLVGQTALGWAAWVLLALL